LTLEVIQLQTWLPQVVKPFQERVQVLEQILKIGIPHRLPLLTSDLSSLERILVELLNNACKYTPTGEKIKVIVRAKPEIIQLKAFNSGVVIPSHELPRIFEKFYRIPSADPWRQGGTGLGLALVQKLIEQLGGFIEVESADAWTCFTVELPLNAAGIDLTLKPSRDYSSNLSYASFS
jgi:signal transduction histidine kinase